jgi:hypothetical protein
MDLFAWEQLPEEGKEVPQRLRPEEEIAKFTVHGMKWHSSHVISSSQQSCNAA